MKSRKIFRDWAGAKGGAGLRPRAARTTVVGLMLFAMCRSASANASARCLDKPAVRAQASIRSHLNRLFIAASLPRMLRTRCHSRKFHPGRIRALRESQDIIAAMLVVLHLLGSLSPTYSSRGAGSKSRIFFFGVSSILPCGVRRTVCGCVGVTGHC